MLFYSIGLFIGLFFFARVCRRFCLYRAIVENTRLFVKDTCAMRAPSHSDAHMEKVWENATRIYCELHPYRSWFRWIDPMYLLISITTLVHDVDDHKYDDPSHTLSTKLETYLQWVTLQLRHNIWTFDYSCPYHYLYSHEKIMAIAHRFSFSNERKNGTEDWKPVLGDTGVYIRNIGSDADKWEAIGVYGIQRCKEYTIEHAEKTGNIMSDVDIYLEVENHYYEKLKYLATHYMRTVPGKQHAMTLDIEMKEALININPSKKKK
jgi:hypothetical protein